MHEHASSNTQSVQPGKARVLRARSLPSARPFRIAVFFSSIHYLGLIGTVTAVVCFMIHPSQPAMKILVGGIIFCAITWLISFFKRRGTFCPLCKGTPLVNSGARTHLRAWRIYPLNHGVSATLCIMATQKFRCMYCGSDYDLLKPRTRLLYGANEFADAEETDRHESRS